LLIRVNVAEGYIKIEQSISDTTIGSVTKCSVDDSQ